MPRFFSATLLFCIGCYSGGTIDGLALVNSTDTGPRIVWDIRAEPLPEIPFPNDVGTRPNLSSPTGKRINVSQQASTQHERSLRGLINELDGFGTFAALSVCFEH